MRRWVTIFLKVHENDNTLQAFLEEMRCWENHKTKTDRKACANYVTSEANHAPITMWSFAFSPFTWVFFRGLFWYTCHEGSCGDSMKTPPFIIKVLSLTIVFILFGVWRYSKTLWAWDFCRANSWWGRSTNQLSPKEIESEWSNCFKMNLLVIRNSTRRVRFYFILFTSALSWAIPLTCNRWRNRLRIVYS